MNITLLSDTFKKIKNYLEKIGNKRLDKNRFIILFFSLLFVADYILFCYISGKSLFDIFPSFPLLEKSQDVKIFIPDVDKNTVLQENRNIYIPDNKESYVRLLIKKCVSGSETDNTSTAVPVELFIRKIWFYNETCIIDTVPSLSKNSIKYPDSEAVFREALQKTITENIPEIKKVILLNRGIPAASLWTQQ